MRLNVQKTLNFYFKLALFLQAAPTLASSSAIINIVDLLLLLTVK